MRYFLSQQRNLLILSAFFGIGYRVKVKGSQSWATNSPHSPYTCLPHIPIQLKYNTTEYTRKCPHSFIRHLLRLPASYPLHCIKTSKHPISTSLSIYFSKLPVRECIVKMRVNVRTTAPLVRSLFRSVQQRDFSSSIGRQAQWGFIGLGQMGMFTSPYTKLKNQSLTI